MVRKTNQIQINEGFPEDWDLKPLKKISSMNGRIGWQGLTQSEFTQNPNEPFLITGINFKDGVIRWDEVYHIPEKRYDEDKNIQLKKNDILMTKDGTIGKLLFVDEIPYPKKASLNSHLLVFRPITKQYTPKFLFYQFQSNIFLEHIEQNKSGSTFFAISQKAVGEYKAYLPEITEQEKIAEVLSDTDNLINKLETLIEKKKNIKKGAMQELLTGKRRLEGFNGEWQEVKFDSLCKSFTKQTGFDYSAYIKPKLVTTFRTGVIPFIQNKDFKAKKINFDTDYYIPEHIANNYVDILLDEKCLLISISGSIGNVAIFSNLKKAFVGGAVGVAKFKNKDNLEWIMYYLLSNQAKKKFFKDTKSGAHHNLTVEGIRDMIIPLPASGEQTAITKILSDIDLEIEILEKKLDKYIKLKQGMMQKLLTGEIRLQ